MRVDEARAWIDHAFDVSRRQYPPTGADVPPIAAPEHQGRPLVGGEIVTKPESLPTASEARLNKLLSDTLTAWEDAKRR